MRGLGLNIFLFLSLAFALTGRAAGPTIPPNESVVLDYDHVIDDLGKYVKSQMANDNIVGLSIALVDRQEIVWARGFGYANREAQIPASADTVYRMGSISKVLTGTAVMQLAEGQKLDIDARVTDYLPQFAMKKRFVTSAPITARNLMTHHAGLPTDLVRGADSKTPQSLSQLVNQLGDVYLAQPPGQVFQYSNLGAAVLGRTIEQISGLSFANYMEKNLFVPLSMKHSSFILDDKVWPNLSKGYINGVQCVQFPVREQPAGALYSSVSDMANFMKMVFAKGTFNDLEVAKKQSINEMLRRQNSNNALDLDVATGLGWQLTKRFNTGVELGKMAWHDGWIWHFSSFMAVLPEKELGVIVVANSSGAKKTVAKIAAKALRAMVQTRPGYSWIELKRQPRAINLSNEQLTKYAGYYDTASGIVNLEPNLGALKGELAGQAIEFVPRKDGTFTMQKLLYGVLPFHSDAMSEVSLEFIEVGNKMLLATLNRKQRIPFGTRIEIPRVPKLWKRRIGKYVNKSQKEDFAYLKSVDIYKKGRLLLAHVVIGGEYTSDMSFTVALKPVTKTQAFVMGIGRYRGDTLRIWGNHLRFLGYQLSRSR